MFHKLLVPVKPEPKPQVALANLARLAGANNAQIIFLVVEIEADIGLAGRSAAFAIDMMRERRDRAEAALLWIREQTITKGLPSETLLVKGDVVDAILKAVDDHRCDAIVLTLRNTAWPGPLVGHTGDKIVRRSTVPVLILKP